MGRSWECGSMVECLPVMLKALGLIPSMEKKKERVKSVTTSPSSDKKSLMALLKCIYTQVYLNRCIYGYILEYIYPVPFQSFWFQILLESKKEYFKFC